MLQQTLQGEERVNDLSLQCNFNIYKNKTQQRA